MNPKVHYGLIAGLILILILTIVFGINQKNKSDSLERQVDNTPTLTKKNKNESIKPNEVKEYKQKLDDKMHEFLKGNYSDDDIFNDGTAGNAIYRLFTVAGLSGLDESSKKKDFEKRYKDVEFELENVSAQKESDGEVTVNSNVKVKIGKGQAEENKLISVTFDTNGNLNGGTLYDKSGKES